MLMKLLETSKFYSMIVFLQCTSSSIATLSETIVAVVLRMRNLPNATDAEEKISFKEYCKVSVLFWRFGSVLFWPSVRCQVGMHVFDFSPTFRFRHVGSVRAQCAPSLRVIRMFIPTRIHWNIGWFN